MQAKKYQLANYEARKLHKIDVPAFALKNPEKWEPDFLNLVLGQYTFLEKLKQKLPEWAHTEGLLGAQSVNIEQSSSSETALEKFSPYSGKTALDLTGGYGIDSFFLTKKFDKIVYCEPHKELFDIVDHNFDLLNLSGIRRINTTAEDFLIQNQSRFDLIFIDPDRRKETNSKLVLIEECSPNLLDIREHLCSVSPTILIKYSPLLDIHRAIIQLKTVSSVKIIAVNNEVKELLFELKPVPSESVTLEAVNLKGSGREIFTFKLKEEAEAMATYAQPQDYLYEPNAAILKSGAFKTISARLQINKLAQHSHFYTSEQIKTDFPGRIFKVHEVMTPNGKNLKKFKNQKVNVISRNYPQKPVTLRQKYTLNDGGDDYLIFTQNHKNEKIVISCTRIFDLNT